MANELTTVTVTADNLNKVIVNSDNNLNLAAQGNTLNISSADNVVFSSINTTTLRGDAINATQMNTGSITASGAVNATQINTASLTASGAVNATQINTAGLTASGAVNATKVNTIALTASQAVNSAQVNARNVAATVVNATTSNTNRLNTFTVSTNVVDAKTVNATQVNTDSITARAAVNATQINTASLTASGAVNATQINTASLTASDAVNATQINTASLTASNAVNSQKVNTKNVKSTTVDAKAVNATQVNTDSITARAAVNATQINTASLTASDAVNATQVNTASLTASNAVNATKVNAEKVNTNYLAASGIIDAARVRTGSLAASGVIDAARIRTGSLAASGIVDAARVRTESLAVSGVFDANRIRTASFSSNTVNTDNLNVVNTINVANGPKINSNGITNLAAGDISEFSTDAINGAQLYQILVSNALLYYPNIAPSELVSNTGLTSESASTEAAPRSSRSRRSLDSFEDFSAEPELMMAMATPASLVLESVDGATADVATLAASPVAVPTTTSARVNADQIIAGTTDVARVNVDQINAGTGNISRVNADQIVGGTGDIARVNADLLVAGTGNIANVNTDLLVAGTANIARIESDVMNANQAVATTSVGVKNGPELTTAGINAADKAISHVKAGTNSTDAVNKAQLDEKADKSTAYTFNVSNNEATLSADALADTWTLEQGDSLTFGATSDLNVTTDGQGKVVYGLSDKVKAKIDTAAAANKGVNVSTKAADGKVTTHNVKSGETVAVHSGKNIAITQNANTITVATVDNPTFAKVTADSVSVKNGPTIDSNGINMNNKRITNVADGVEATDAVNVRQLNQTRNDFDKRLDRLNKDRKAGTASAIATAGLLQAPAGQSGVTAAVGQYESQSAVAVGYSQSLPSGVGVKVSFSANTRKELGGSVGMGYFW
ncbi:YadA family autotransporter adhesin [Actinobacillus equuli]|nr:YadA-like family protein [Actinobacillus equuli]